QAGTQTFGPWGNVTSGGSSATARNYTGQYLDSASGLLYDHARYYDAVLGRFISADSVVPGQTATSGAPNPQELNRYSYGLNNPVKNTDPTGHCIEDACIGEAALLAAAAAAAEPEIEEGVEAATPVLEAGAEQASEVISEAGASIGQAASATAS